MVSNLSYWAFVCVPRCHTFEPKRHSFERQLFKFNSSFNAWIKSISSKGTNVFWTKCEGAIFRSDALTIPLYPFVPLTVVSSSNSGVPASYPGMMTTTTTTAALPSVVTPTFVMPTASDPLTSILANYPGLNLSSFLQAGSIPGSGQSLSSQSKWLQYLSETFHPKSV